MEFHEKERSVNKKLTDALYSVSRLLEDYYDLAEAKDLSQENKSEIKDLAAELKNHTTVLQNMMGAETAKDPEPEDKKEKAEKKSSAGHKDEFLAGLEED